MAFTNIIHLYTARISFLKVIISIIKESINAMHYVAKTIIVACRHVLDFKRLKCVERFACKIYYETSPRHFSANCPPLEPRARVLRAEVIQVISYVSGTRE